MLGRGTNAFGLAVPLIESASVLAAKEGLFALAGTLNPKAKGLEGPMERGERAGDENPRNLSTCDRFGVNLYVDEARGGSAGFFLINVDVSSAEPVEAPSSCPGWDVELNNAPPP